MSIFGWDGPKQAAVYTRKANRKRLAGDAMHMLVPDQNRNESLPLSVIGNSRGSIGDKKSNEAMRTKRNGAQGRN